VAYSFFKSLKVEMVFGVVVLDANFAQRVLLECFEVTYNFINMYFKLNQLTIPEFKNINLNLRWVASAYPPPTDLAWKSIYQDTTIRKPPPHALKEEE